MRKQVAALPVRKKRNGRLEVLLITSRKKGKWLIPKGWPVRGLSDRKAAAKEAKEEAGVSGRIRSKPIGSYRYAKRSGEKPIRVKVFILKVERQKKRWRECDERRRKWAIGNSAARSVKRDGLRKLLLSVAKRQ
jgi:8-oxo-dGTP pyrophosphatase MutT (NUDIX family)